MLPRQRPTSAAAVPALGCRLSARGSERAANDGGRPLWVPVLGCRLSARGSGKAANDGGGAFGCCPRLPAFRPRLREDGPRRRPRPQVASARCRLSLRDSGKAANDDGRACGCCPRLPALRPPATEKRPTTAAALCGCCPRLPAFRPRLRKSGQRRRPRPQVACASCRLCARGSGRAAHGGGDARARCPRLPALRPLTPKSGHRRRPRPPCCVRQLPALPEWLPKPAKDGGNALCVPELGCRLSVGGSL